ncbi:MAG: CoA-acylating methylmalonate-semialdehyde dehydrogenase [Deltaproteobacteria bacterium]|nr:CoA-acylating methylmalonate-semialdehyde dehydrogenase [Deltaproteobacteria bacterium]
MTRIESFVDGRWVSGRSGLLPVRNPASGEVVAEVALSTAEDVAIAVEAAKVAFKEWRRTPAGERIQYLFKFKNLLEESFEEIAKTITLECGKTLEEARAELRRGIENVEVACGIPLMAQGYNNEDIARGIDELMIRQPVGVVAAITPFNFPGMIPLWFLPYGIATGNCFILKPSERVPMTAFKLVSLLERTGLPKGVIQLVHGQKPAVDALLSHPGVRAVSFVGSTAVARYIYSEAARYGKRAQCQGGAKNPVIVLPDADMETTTKIIADSAFGCAGQRCLAASIAVTVGGAREPFTQAMVDLASRRTVGFGLEAGVEMGPVITPESRQRILGLVERGVSEGAKLLVDGRDRVVKGFESGNFVGPTIMESVDPRSEVGRTEVFGPVLSMIHVNRVEDAIALVNEGAYGNMACLFTTSGASARRFRYEAEVGNIGINVGVAAPMAFFPFSGWKESFFGDLHAQGWDAIEFYTEKKVVVERWPKEWTRKF